MTLSVAYWILMLLYLLFGGWWVWQTPPEGRPGPAGWSLLLFLILLTLGLKVFGGPLKG